MNYDEIFNIINQLKEINSFKAKKLIKLVEKHINEGDPNKQEAIEKKIKRYVYLIFISMLTKESKHEINDLGLEILEECNSIEKEANDRWVIDYTGAYKYDIVDGRAIIVDRIPRSYKIGFQLPSEATTYTTTFYELYQPVLSMLSSKMDRRQEVITYRKKPKNAKISSEFLEELVDYLHLPRIMEEKDKEKENQKTYKKEF